MALPAGALVVNSSQGGGSKDTWVLAADGVPAIEPQPVESPVAAPAPAHAPDAAPGIEFAGSQQQQQQQAGPC